MTDADYLRMVADRLVGLGVAVDTNRLKTIADGLERIAGAVYELAHDVKVLKQRLQIGD